MTQIAMNFLRFTESQNHYEKWRGQLPNGWRIEKLKYIAFLQLSNVDKHTVEGQESVQLCNYTDVYNNEKITSAIPFMHATATVEQIKRLSLQKSDVLLTKDSETPDDIGVPAVVLEELMGVVCGYHLAIARPKPDVVIGEFLFRAIQSEPVKKYFFSRAVGMTRYGLDKQALAETPIALPDLAKQRAIADYLDRQTAKLDALIATKERLLHLLAEKRRALITHAVTRGLNPDAPMRDSGIEWLGEIPAHWGVVRLRRVLASMDYGISKSVGPEGKIAVLRMGDISDGEIIFDNVGFVDEVDSGLLLNPGDLLFNRTNSLALVGKVGLFRDEFKFPTSFASYLVRLQCNETVLPEYLNYILNSSPILTWARSEALPAIGQANLNPNRYSYLLISLPPIEEQHLIVKHLNSSTQHIDNLRTAIEQTIELLHERRTALIAAAVSGQVRVGA